MRTFTKVWLGIAFVAIGIGTAILVIAAASGASVRDIPTYSFAESYEGVNSLDVEIEYGSVTIIEGDTFSIDADRLPRENMESYVSDGTWIIREDANRYIDVFGFHISAGNFFNWRESLTPRITITVPEGFVAEDISLEMSAGDVKADVIRANTGDFNVSAGRLTINQLEITEESGYTVGAGQMKLDQVIAKNVTIDCGVGDIVVHGRITGDSEIACSVGNVDLRLEGDKEDYSYEVSASIGNVSIDNNSYHNILSKVINQSEAENKFSLNCEIGNISVDFN
jgi:hypothetical protein